LECVESDYVALLDVDSRVSESFVESCVGALERNGSAFLASGPREVTNEGEGLAPLAVSAEYRLIGDLYRLAARTGGFLQFNGLIGVARVDELWRGLNEEVSCEDVEFATRAYMEGLEAELVPAEVGEQAPPAVRDLYLQRVRWLSGALECLSGYGRSFAVSGAQGRAVVSWYTEMAAPLLLVALSPLYLLSPLYGLRLLHLGVDRVVAKSFLLPLLGFMLAWCSVVAMGKRAAGVEPEWTVAERT